MTNDDLMDLARAGGPTALLDVLPHAVLLINRDRQIVYANPACVPLLQAKSTDDVIGIRPGEAMDCRHHDETPGGCGTTRFCSQCGANTVLRAAQRGHHAASECRIVSKTLGRDLDLRVWADQLRIGDAAFTLFSISDISAEKRREMLERVFFHDVLNTAASIQGTACLCAVISPDKRGELSDTVVRLCAELIEELKAQQSLPLMERGELLVRREPVASLEILHQVADAYRAHDATGSRVIRIAADSAAVTFDTDPVLLRRVIGNMTKNALEACGPGGLVTLRCDSDGPTVAFGVHNASVMPLPVQLQVFQRSFSTKGPGRGLGTYSMKLISERYLNGTVTFVSVEGHGTTFVAAYPRTAVS